jgi:hypothetical protein
MIELIDPARSSNTDSLLLVIYNIDMVGYAQRDAFKCLPKTMPMSKHSVLSKLLVCRHMFHEQQYNHGLYPLA